MNKSPIAATAAVVASLALAIAAFAADTGTVEPSNHIVAVSAPALDDPTIVVIFDAANTADIETGQLAAKKGSTKEVREFGAMLVRDHKAVRQQGRDLAAKLGVTPTPPTDDASAKSHAAAMTALRAARGAEFDHAFLQHEVAFHKAVIDAVTSTLLPAISNAELKKLVLTVAPAFQAHMIAADNLDKKHVASRNQ
jgi:putative membrane protein